MLRIIEIVEKDLEIHMKSNLSSREKWPRSQRKSGKNRLKKLRIPESLFNAFCAT
jgi:hypothetical protein